jgi:hypothetical protein
MYSICGKTLAMALTALWVAFTPIQPVPQTTPINDHRLPQPPAAHAILRSQSEEPVSVELRVPAALVNALLTVVHPGETIDLRMPEVLLEHLYDAGHISEPEKSPVLCGMRSSEAEARSALPCTSRSRAMYW